MVRRHICTFSFPSLLRQNRVLDISEELMMLLPPFHTFVNLGSYMVSANLFIPPMYLLDVQEGRYAIVTNRWQKFSDVYLDDQVLDFLAKYADEFLVHGVDVEGKK